MKRPIKKVGLYQIIEGASLRPDPSIGPLVSSALTIKTPKAEQLSDVLQREVCIDWRRVCAMTLDLCSRLASLHRNGTAHGKLDPSKIVAETDQGSLRNARIANPSLLSLSANTDDKSAWDKAAFPYFSAEHFLSPEQKAGKKPTPASDIYALGALMYTALTGSPPAPPEQKLNPFKRNENLHSKLSAYGVPKQLESIVLRCLKVNPRDRYQSSDDLLSAIAWWDPWLDRSRKSGLRSLIQPALKTALIASAVMAFVGLSSLVAVNFSNSATMAKGDDAGMKITIMFSPGQCSINAGNTSTQQDSDLVADNQ